MAATIRLSQQHSCSLRQSQAPSFRSRGSSLGPPRRLLLLLVPDRTGLALFDLPDAQTFELPAPGAPLSPSCHLASHLLGLPVPQKLSSGQLAAVGRMMHNDARGIAQ